MTNVGSVFVTVIPSARGFTKKLKRDIDSDLSKLGKEMGANFTDSLSRSLSNEFNKNLPKVTQKSGKASGKAFGGAFQRELKKNVGKALDGLGEVEIGVATTKAEQDLKDLRASLIRLNDQNIGVDLSTEQFLAEVKNIERDLTALNAQSPDIEVRANTGQALAELALVQAAVSKLDGSDIDLNTNVSGLRDAQFGVSGLVTAVAALGPALVPVTVALGGLASALVAPLAAAGAGGGLYAIFTGVAISRLKETQKEIDKLRGQAASAADPERAAKLTQAANELEASLSSGERAYLKAEGLLGKTFDSFIDQNTDAIFGPVNEGLGLLSKTLPLMKPVITAVSGSLTSMLEGVSKAVESPGFKSFMTAFGSYAAQTLTQFGTIVANTGTGLFNLFKGLRPLSDSVMQGIQKLTGAFAAWSQSAQGQNSIAGFVEYVQRVGPLVLSTFGSMVRAIVALGKALAPIGEFVLGSLKVLSDVISALPVPILRALIATLIAGVVAMKAFNVANKIYNTVLAAQTKGTFANALAMRAKLVVTKATTFATKAWTVAQRALNFVLSNNPIGRLIMILTGLGLALTLAYRKSDTFRKIVNTAWSHIKVGISVAWAVVKKVFAAYRFYIMNVLAPVFRFLWNKVISPVMGWIGKRISSIWNGAIKPAFSALRSGVSRVGDAFSAVRDRIRSVWDGIRSLVRKPIEASVRVVNSFIGGINSLIPGPGPLSKIAGFAKGGWTGPGARLTPAGLVHADEFVVSKASRRAFEKNNPGVLDHINKTGEMPLHGAYAAGGRVVPGRGNQHSRAQYPWATYAGDFPNPIGTPVRSWKGGMVALVRSLTTSYGKHIRVNHDDGTSSLYAHLSRFFVRQGQKVRQGQHIGAVGSTGNSTGPHLHFETMGGPYTGGSGAPAEQSAWSWLSDKFNFSKKIKSLVSGMSGKTGIFGKGLTDLTKNMASKVWDAMKSKIGDLTGTAGKIGKGIFKKVSGFFDQGGIASGTGFLAKNTIKPERVLDPHQTILFGSLVTSLERASRSTPTSVSGSRSGSAEGAIEAFAAALESMEWRAFIEDWDTGEMRVEALVESAIDRMNDHNRQMGGM